MSGLALVTPLEGFIYRCLLLFFLITDIWVFNNNFRRI